MCQHDSFKLLCIEHGQMISSTTVDWWFTILCVEFELLVIFLQYWFPQFLVSPCKDQISPFHDIFIEIQIYSIFSLTWWIFLIYCMSSKYWWLIRLSNSCTSADDLHPAVKTSWTNADTTFLHHDAVFLQIYE